MKHFYIILLATLVLLNIQNTNAVKTLDQMLKRRSMLSTTQATTMPGKGVDIGAGGDGVWVLGLGSVTGGKEIFRWDGSWTRVQGGAVSITVASKSTVYIASSVGQVFAYDNNGGWRYLNAPFTAQDVGVHPKQPSTVWATATTSNIYRSTDGGSSWQKVTGGADRIAVDSSGNAWAIFLGDKTIWKWNGSGWDRVAGSATDIACGPSTCYCVGLNSKIHEWRTSSFQGLTTDAVRIGGVDNNNRLYYIQADGTIGYLPV